MKATGQIQFTRHPDALVTYQWTGGRRVAIAQQLIASLGMKPRIGAVLPLLPDLTLRIVDLAVDSSSAATDTYIAMREGRLARFVAGYVRWLHEHAAAIYDWECRWLRGQPAVEDDFYPKWSIVGLLCRPLMQ